MLPKPKLLLSKINNTVLPYLHWVRVSLLHKRLLFIKSPITNVYGRRGKNNRYNLAGGAGFVER